ncbi:hypothetical protein CkaCkLH20_09616 [Colletotrichum karsti]|uniref:Secondary metabolism regulator LAE1 n=1 Tax=Colletotrichum karsti TaxID=1095194 RepID=A0A9P6HWH2_9PEZI|nr:uncharacterized protein CkaCkLH20_09616 [Colletotrichum karsti]KAF9872753.1 hypothetical protein CkaCkLH20_09616 [Colletotrichum karsti]
MQAPNTATGASNTAEPNTTTDNEVSIAVDDQYNEDDSASEFGVGSVASSSTSVTSSIMRFREENGRTYHGYKDGKYMMPNDGKEVDRLDLQHNLFMLTFDGKLATAPPNERGSNVKRVLDIGTGSGIWAMDFGDEHPEAEVLGIDLSPVQPEFTPPNVKFEIDDFEEAWTYTQPFDYIHSRMMTGCVADWKEYFQKCFDNLSPGGYFELVEPDIVVKSDDGTLKPDHTIVKTGNLMIEATAAVGRMFQQISHLKPVLMEVGFEDVTLQQFKWPVNSWPKDPKMKELGMWHNENLLLGWEAICMAPLVRGLGWSYAEVQVLLAENRRDFNNRNIHSYFPIWTMYGRKPQKKE